LENAPSHAPRANGTPLTRTHPSRNAFTLIELVAVLGILSVVAGLLASSLIGRLKRATRESDSISVAAMTEALRIRILRAQSIPAAAGIPAAIAEELALPLSRVQASLAGYPRVFLIDPNLQLGAPTGITFTLPFTQTARGSIEPVSPRFMILSSLGDTIPVSSPTTTGTFTSLWNHASGSIPASWNSWKGEADDLRFGRLDFRSLFHRVVFNNLDPVNTATYSVGETTNTVSLSVGQRVETWFLSGSAINLHLASSAVQTREFLRTDSSYIFENGRWSRDLMYGVQPPLGAFGLLVQDFLDSPIPPDAKFGASPQAVIEEFFTYMYTYGIWATGIAPDVPPFETGGSTSEQQVPAFRSLKDAQARLDSYAGNLID